MSSSTAFNAYLTTPASITQKAIQAAVDIEEKSRKEQAQLNKDFYYGKQEQALTLMNEDVDPIVINFTKPVMDKRCRLLYSRPLHRVFTGPAQSVAHLESVYLDNDIDSLLQQADLLSELTGSVLIHPYQDEATKSGYRLRIYDGTQFSAVGNDGDPNTADAISLIRVVDRVTDGSRLGQDGSIRSERILAQQIWTREAVVFYEGSMLKGSMENPLGFLPFVNIHGEEVHDEFVGYAPAINVRKLNAQINQMVTHLSHTIKMQAGTPIALTGFQSGETITMHPGRALNLPANANASVLDLNPKINETLTTIKYLEDRLFATSSVPKISVEGGDGDKTHISGAQLVVRWYPLINIFNQKAVKFLRYELTLANLILAVAGLPFIDDVEIDYPEESVVPQISEVQQLDQELRLGLTTPIDEIQKRNPLYTDLEAEIEWRTNMEINSVLDTSNQPQQSESQGAN
jgi:hypothetical protein